MTHEEMTCNFQVAYKKFALSVKHIRGIKLGILTNPNTKVLPHFVMYVCVALGVCISSSPTNWIGFNDFNVLDFTLELFRLVTNEVIL
jgi:hypothetical protein